MQKQLKICLSTGHEIDYDATEVYLETTARDLAKLIQAHKFPLLLYGSESRELELNMEEMRDCIFLYWDELFQLTGSSIYRQDLSSPQVIMAKGLNALLIPYLIPFDLKDITTIVSPVNP